MDRLAELKAGAAPLRSSRTAEIAIDVDNSAGPYITSESSNNLKQALVENPMMQDNQVHDNNTDMQSGLKKFLDDAESIQGNIAQIKKASEDIDELTQDIKLSTSASEDEQKSANIQSLIAKTNKNAFLAKKMIKALTDETAQLKSGGQIKGAELRIRETMVSTISRKFQLVVTRYQAVQESYKRDVTSKLTRQIKIAKPDISDDYVNQLLQSGSAGEFMSSAILKGADTAVDEVKDSLRSANDKYAEVLNLEKSMAELRGIFQDFALLVENQAELLDQIQYQVELASDHIDEGNKEMVAAIDHLKDVRKWQFIICLIILVVIAAIILIIYFTKGRKN